MSLFYRVARYDEQTDIYSSWMASNPLRVTYRIDSIVVAPPPTRLFVFRDLDDALRFLEPYHYQADPLGDIRMLAVDVHDPQVQPTMLQLVFDAYRTRKVINAFWSGQWDESLWIKRTVDGCWSCAAFRVVRLVSDPIEERERDM